MIIGHTMRPALLTDATVTATPMGPTNKTCVERHRFGPNFVRFNIINFECV